MPNGAPVELLSTGGRDDGDEKLLNIRYVKTGEKSPEWKQERQRVTTTMSAVTICVHQDAILHLAEEVSHICTYLKKPSKNTELSARTLIED